MPKKPNPVTVKDCLYALQFAGEQLVGTIRGAGAGNTSWQLSGSKLPVVPSVANEVIRQPGVVHGPASGLQSIIYVWEKK